MKENLKKKFKEWWESVEYKKIWRFVEVLITMFVIFCFLVILSEKLSVLVLCLLDGMMVIILSLVCVRKEAKEEQEKDYLEFIAQILPDRKDYEVCFKENIEKFALDGENRLFLDMLKFFQKHSQAKMYVNFEQSSKTLFLKVKANKEERVFDNISYEIFLDYFMRISEATEDDI